MFLKNVVLAQNIISDRYMEVFTEVAPLQDYLQTKGHYKKDIGLVPTMGALHEGHISLIKQSMNENKLTVCSIYVNPTQFNRQSDLENYPRKLNDDIAFLEKNGCDILFAPSDKGMYPSLPLVKLGFGHLERIMEGEFREGHFNGVGVIVSKLLNIINPGRAYFGQKDIQQFFIIKQLVKDLSFQVELVKVPTVRENDGLAMSSRNLRLSPEHRSKAPLLHQSLVSASKMLKNGTSIDTTNNYVRELFLKDNDFQLEYFEVVSSESLEILDQKPEKGTVILCIAAYLGEIRLIDNIFLIL